MKGNYEFANLQEIFPEYINTALIEAMNEFLKPIQEKRKYYEDHPEEVDRVLEKGTKDAEEKAIETMKQVKQALKIDY